MEMQLLKSFVNEMIFFYIIDFKWILKIYDFLLTFNDNVFYTLEKENNNILRWLFDEIDVS